ncbi:MAG: creatininase family protein [candidate division NC10 bacterium]|nr:creatininase family protein [candidate division NC10 bacterium]
MAPPLPYGVCRTMRNFPGTISLAPATLGAVVREVVAEYIRHGGRKFALITGHAEPAQMEAMREAVLPLVNADAGLVVLTIGPYDFLDPIRREADLVSKDGHAGSIETSEMLVVAEQMVRMDRLPKVTRPRLSRFRVLANPETEYPAGVRGDTSKVSRELGERAIRHVVSEIATLLERIEREGTE